MSGDNADHECTDGDWYYGTREQCVFCTAASRGRGARAMSGEVPDDPEARRNFVPSDPTEEPDFNPANWTGTILSGLISIECGLCGSDWHEGPCA
jgi:hypothetical protein